MKRLNVRLIVSATCEEASRLASESLDRKLTFSERWALRFHALVCRSCRAFARQIRAIHAAVHRMPGPCRDRLQQQIVRLSPERRRELKRLLANTGRGDAP